MITGKQLIENQYMASGQTTFQAANPATNEPLMPHFFTATEEEINHAIFLADQAFTEYSAVSFSDRANFLRTIANQLEANTEAITERAGLETGLPDGRLKGEMGRTCNQLRLFASFIESGAWTQPIIDLGDPSRTPNPKPDIRQMQIPLGPVGIFGASNFPLAFSVAGGDTASALAAGCPVIVKGHPAHPGTSELVGQAIQQAASICNMPTGVFSLVQGASYEVGLAIVNHPLIKAIGFTGSFWGGKALFDAANRRSVPIPVYAEMGSTNPVFLLPEALATQGEALQEGLANSVNLGVGQFCTNPGLVLGIDDPSLTDFIQSLGQTIREKAAGVMLHQGIYKAYNAGLKEMEVATEVIAKGVLSDAPNAAQSVVFKTSAKQIIANPNLTQEIFGPSTLLAIANNETELLEAAAAIEGHLTATIHGTENDLKKFRPLIQILQQKVGRLIFNGFPTGVEVGHAMVHGGPYPATTNDRTTSVGTQAIYRFTRPICYQDFPNEFLPEALKDGNPLGIFRKINGALIQ